MKWLGIVAVLLIIALDPRIRAQCIDALPPVGEWLAGGVGSATIAE